MASKKFYSPDSQDPSKIPNDELWNWVKNNIVSKRNALDVGGHIGTMAYRMSDCFKHVHCFEPAFYEWTMKNTDELDNVTVYPHGLGNEEKDEKLYVMKNKIGGSSIVATEKRKARWIRDDTEQRPITIKTIDSYGFTDLDFIKIDVESYEWFVLDGAKETLQRESPMIMIEFLKRYEHPTHPSNKSRKLLENLGYVQISYHQADYIFIKKTDKLLYGYL